MVLFKKQRRDYTNKITSELVNCRFGAPKGSIITTVPVKDLKNFEPIKTILDVFEEYVETGNQLNGEIPFNMIGRVIKYSLSNLSLDQNNVNLIVV